MPLNILECQVSELVNSDTCPRPTTKPCKQSRRVKFPSTLNLENKYLACKLWLQLAALWRKACSIRIVALELNPDDIGLSGDRLGCDSADRAPALAGRLRFQVFTTFADYDVALVRPYLAGRRRESERSG